jgi:hypothetical protein
MDASEIFEDMRSRLNELQVNTVDRPWEYELDDLIPRVRSAMRYLRAANVYVNSTMSGEGVLSAPVTTIVGVLVSALATMNMIKGDLLGKLRDGELGVIFRTGADLIDTKTSALRLDAGVATLEAEVATLMAIALSSIEQSNIGSEGAYHYGGQEPYADG